MQFKVLDSGSTGNCYILESSTGERLIIDAGIHINKVKEAVEFNLSSIVGVIVSHSHMDHALSIINFLKASVNVYCLTETAEAVKAVSHRLNIITIGKSFSVGNFKVKSFELVHDVRNVGFLIEHEEMGRVVYITDTCYCPFTFPGLNNIIVEANYDLKIIDSNGTAKFLRDRILQSHLSLKNCKDLLLANDLSKVNNIVLIHLSKNNSDAQAFKSDIQSITGSTVNIATAGLIIPFNKTPF